jgi:hypothetical protein
MLKITLFIYNKITVIFHTDDIYSGDIYSMRYNGFAMF